MITMFSSHEVATLHQAWQAQPELYRQVPKDSVHAVLDNPKSYLILANDPFIGIVGSCRLQPVQDGKSWECVDLLTFDALTRTMDDWEPDFFYYEMYSQFLSFARTHGIRDVVLKLNAVEQERFVTYASWPVIHTEVQGACVLNYVDLSLIPLLSLNDEVLFIRRK